MSDIPDLPGPEALFPPRPGGMVDTARKQRQAGQDQLDALGEAGPAAQGRIDVPVNDHAAELARARTFAVSTLGAPVVQLLGQDLRRRYAVLLTLDEPVVISFSLASAQDQRNAVNAAGLPANGFVLPVGVPVPVNSSSVIWCTPTSATPTRVSVMAFSYAGG